MKLLTLFIAIAALATVATLVLGIAAMAAPGGQVAHRTSERWMSWRVAFQALALGLLFLALLETR
jgi:hypothetical protein